MLDGEAEGAVELEADAHAGAALAGEGDRAAEDDGDVLGAMSDHLSVGVSSDGELGLPEVEPPAPDPPALPAAAPAGEVAPTLVLPSGTLRVYFNAGKSTIVAHCPHHGARRRLTRSAHGSDRAGRSGQGRCIGLLLLWLEAHSADGVVDAFSHVHLEPDRGREAFHADRLRLRDAFNASPMHVEFSRAWERPQRPDEGREPAVVPR